MPRKKAKKARPMSKAARSATAKKAWRTRRKKYGRDGVKG